MDDSIVTDMHVGQKCQDRMWIFRQLEREKVSQPNGTLAFRNKPWKEIQCVLELELFEERVSGKEAK